MLRQATYGTARIGLHTAFSEKLQELNGGNAIPFYQKFFSSFLSGAIASSIGNPFDVAVRVPAPRECAAHGLRRASRRPPDTIRRDPQLVRVQADTTKPVAERYGYKGVGDALTRIVKEEGFGALYRGYPPVRLTSTCSLATHFLIHI